MAWQLIYTSASRLLDPGRSGFGTVARHREMSALLVSALERISQFNRMPGLDDSRIIFAFRHIAISGSRFHVLSRICDAGSDYSGRTNHIAHHVVLTTREIATLRENKITPVDFICSLLSDELANPALETVQKFDHIRPNPTKSGLQNWYDRWDEPPNFFEESDNISNEGICRVVGLPAKWWEYLSGDSRRAALLASPEIGRAHV